MEPTATLTIDPAPVKQEPIDLEPPELPAPPPPSPCIPFETMTAMDFTKALGLSFVAGALVGGVLAYAFSSPVLIEHAD